MTQQLGAVCRRLIARFPSLPCQPYARLSELLRRIAFFSATVTLGALLSDTHGWMPRVVALASISGLVAIWRRSRGDTTWTPAVQAAEGVLIAAAVLASPFPSMVLPVLYGGLNYRALGRPSGAAFRAATVYLLAFAAAVAIHPSPFGFSLADTIAIVLPGAPICAVTLHALSRALIRQERAEARLRESETYLQTLVHGAPLAIVALSNDDKVTLWNPAAARMFGWSADDVIGKPLPFVPDDAVSSFASAREVERRGEARDHREIRCARIDGTSMDVLLSTAPLRDASGSVHGTIGVLADISDRKALEEQLRQSQKMEAVGRLAGGIAHDFNNLLTVIIAHAGFLRAELGRHGQSAESIQEIERAANGAASLTRQLLAFSRKQVLKPIVQDLNETVAGLAAMLQRVLGEDIAIEPHLCDEHLPVRVDRGQLEQVIMNLVVNARDAMPWGGTLRIHTEIVHEAHGPISCETGLLPSGSFAVLVVEDTGIGMSHELQLRIFEPFFTTKEPGSGTGLGLSTVFGIVAQSNGHLAVSSRPGEGSKFSIYLPMQIAEAEPSFSSGAPEIPRRKSGETILLAEDSAEVRALATRVLERAGYTVLPACDGIEAIEIASSFSGRIDLVLTDAVMPNVGGGELVNALRETRNDFRVLYMTGYMDDDLIRRGLGEEQDQLINKPFTPTALADVVRRVLETPAKVA